MPLSIAKVVTLFVSNLEIRRNESRYERDRRKDFQVNMKANRVSFVAHC
jgi:hypothetical protein